jgi:hypothetical protein
MGEHDTSTIDALKATLVGAVEFGDVAVEEGPYGRRSGEGWVDRGTYLVVFRRRVVVVCHRHVERGPELRSGGAAGASPDDNRRRHRHPGRRRDDASREREREPHRRGH